MRLAPRLWLVFGGLAALSTSGVGALLRYDLERTESARFEQEVVRACEQIKQQVARAAERDRLLVQNACNAGELVDRVAVVVARGDLSAQRLRFAQLVPQAREAFQLDELQLLVDSEVIGAAPRELFTRGELPANLRAAPVRYGLRTAPEPAIEVMCRKEAGPSSQITLIGARALSPLVAQWADELQLRVALVAPRGAQLDSDAEAVRAECIVSDEQGSALGVRVERSKQALQATIVAMNRRVLSATVVVAVLALFLALLLARSLGRPLSLLAVEARKVTRGEAKPLQVKGSGEVRELVLAFDHMLSDLAEAKSRLAAASRVAAWREVAKRVAHEIKNPLAPIRAAVETLRRLRARKDAAFDEYFDEATRTVLDEVHRISAIVAEFSQFARLPPPSPSRFELTEVVRQVLALHENLRPKCVVFGHFPPGDSSIEADRDQLVQVLTNLLQNALDAVDERGGGRVDVYIELGADSARLRVEDDGPGVPVQIEKELFSPYVSSKVHGTGLGLAISQRIADEHGGSLRYRRRADGAQGACFELTLPRRSALSLL